MGLTVLKKISPEEAAAALGTHPQNGWMDRRDNRVQHCWSECSPSTEQGRQEQQHCSGTLNYTASRRPAWEIKSAPTKPKGENVCMCGMCVCVSVRVRACLFPFYTRRTPQGWSDRSAADVCISSYRGADTIPSTHIRRSSIL